MNFQFVEVSLEGKPFTYLWEGEFDLKVGDWVMVPPTPKNESEAVVQVIATETDWEGPVRNILRKAESTEVPK